MVQCPPTGGCAVERPKKKNEKPSLAAQCRVLTEAAVLWALLAVFAGTGILAYFICALVMPEDDTQV